jgi:hypothetical protein
VLLKDSKEGLLESQGKLTHLVQKQGTAVGVLDEPVLRLNSAGEGPLLVTEERALDEWLRQCRAIHDREVFARAGTVVMDGPSDELFPSACLSVDENVGPTPRGLGH